MKNKKLIIILVIILIVYGIAMFILFNNNGSSSNNNNNNTKEEKKGTDVIEVKDNTPRYVVIDNSTWMYRDNKWSKTMKSTIKNSTNLFKVYDDNDYLGECFLEYVNNWNIFDSDKNYINHKGKIFAYTNDFDLRVIRTNPTKLTEEEKTYIINNIGNKTFDSLLVNELINIDLDNNGVIDKLVIISNNGVDDSPTYYNLIYIVLNGNLNKLIDTNNYSSMYEFNRIIEINSSRYIIIKEVKDFIGEQSKEINHLYKLEGDNFREIMSD